MPAPSTTLHIDGESYTLVKTRLHSDVSVYRGAHSYLRVGPESLVRREADFNKLLVEAGFPVARVLREGRIEGQYFYEEESLGDTLLGQIFASETERDGHISEASFGILLSLAESWLAAQIA